MKRQEAKGMTAVGRREREREQPVKARFVRSKVAEGAVGREVERKEPGKTLYLLSPYRKGSGSPFMIL